MPDPTHYDLQQAAIDREEQLQAARRAVPSTSETLVRCAACGHWIAPTRAVCPGCKIGR